VVPPDHDFFPRLRLHLSPPARFTTTSFTADVRPLERDCFFRPGLLGRPIGALSYSCLPRWIWRLTRPRFGAVTLDGCSPRATRLYAASPDSGPLPSFNAHTSQLPLFYWPLAFELLEPFLSSLGGGPALPAPPALHCLQFAEPSLTTVMHRTARAGMLPHTFPLPLTVHLFVYPFHPHSPLGRPALPLGTDSSPDRPHGFCTTTAGLPLPPHRH